MANPGDRGEFACSMWRRPVRLSPLARAICRRLLGPPATRPFREFLVFGQRGRRAHQKASGTRPSGRCVALSGQLQLPRAAIAAPPDRDLSPRSRQFCQSIERLSGFKANCLEEMKPRHFVGLPGIIKDKAQAENVPQHFADRISKTRAVKLAIASSRFAFLRLIAISQPSGSRRKASGRLFLQDFAGTCAKPLRSPSPEPAAILAQAQTTLPESLYDRPPRTLQSSNWGQGELPSRHSGKTASIVLARAGRRAPRRIDNEKRAFRGAESHCLLIMREAPRRSGHASSDSRPRKTCDSDIHRGSIESAGQRLRGFGPELPSSPPLVLE